ncbi:MAG: chemotaxis protein CheX [Deferribacterales bacterium]|nr:chemotaxis protein CheX [Deferribacterales bacterium]
MKAEHINCVISSVLGVLSQALGAEATKEGVYVKKDDSNGSHLSAVIEVTGDHKGAFIISLSEDDAKRMASVLLMEEKNFLDSDVMDAMGEIINMISGGAKAALVKLGLNFKLTPPVFILGKGTKLFRSVSYVPYIGVSFTSDVGNFSVEVSLK